MAGSRGTAVRGGERSRQGKASDLPRDHYRDLSRLRSIASSPAGELGRFMHLPARPLWRPQLPDPADDLVLEIAVSGRCDTIVTFNRDHFVGSDRFAIGIETPAEFLLSLHAKGAL